MPTQPERALGAAVVCYFIWGLIPLLFIFTGRAGASSWEILGERAVWSAPWALALVMVSGHMEQVRRVFASPRLFGLLALSGLMIGSGWSVFLWAVNHGKNIEASLGYYINPLLNMALGPLIFRERIDGVGVTAIALAGVGVALQTVALGHLPLIALFLAITFTIYGVIRKQVPVDAQAGLFVECLLIAIPGLALTLWLGQTGGARFGHGALVTTLLLAMGPATVAPLAMFAWTARRLPLSTVAFLQFMGPTLGFLIGIWNGERLTMLGAWSFVFIWAGVAVFLVGAWRSSRRLAGVTFEAATQPGEA